MPNELRPLTDSDLHAAGFTRVLLLNEGAAFRADYEGHQYLGWTLPCPDVVADVIAPRRMAWEGGSGARQWPKATVYDNMAGGQIVACIRLMDLPASFDRTKLGTTTNLATGENTYERSDAETMAAYQQGLEAKPENAEQSSENRTPDESRPLPGSPAPAAPRVKVAALIDAVAALAPLAGDEAMRPLYEEVGRAVIVDKLRREVLP